MTDEIDNKTIKFYFIIMRKKILILLLFVSCSDLLLANQIEQKTKGWCSHAFGDMQGNVTINCYGIDPKVSRRFNELLEKKDLEIQDKVREAKRWAEKFQALSRMLNYEDDELSQKAARALRGGRLEQAGLLLNELIEKTQKLEHFVAENHYKRGLVYDLQFKPSLAFLHYEKAVVLVEKNPEYLFAAGVTARSLGQYEQAEVWLERIESSGKYRGEISMSAAIFYHELALLYHEQGQYVRAEPLYLRSLQIKEQLFGSDHEDVAITLNNLANVYRLEERYDISYKFYQRSLKIKKRVFGELHPEVATTLNNIAGLYENQDRYRQAEKLYQKALRIKQRELGSKHLSVSIILNNLANLYRKQGYYRRSEKLYQESLAIIESILGKEHPKAAIMLNNLAMLYDVQNQYKKAGCLYQSSISLLKKQFPEGHPDLQKVKNNYDDMKRLFKRYKPSNFDCSV